MEGFRFQVSGLKVECQERRAWSASACICRVSASVVVEFLFRAQVFDELHVQVPTVQSAIVIEQMHLEQPVPAAHGRTQAQAGHARMAIQPVAGLTRTASTPLKAGGSGGRRLTVGKPSWRPSWRPRKTRPLIA
jgi:hypothetical protein